MESLSRFDIYSTNKTHDDLKVRTLGGAGISVVMSVFALILFVSEFRNTFHLETVDKLDVDTTAQPDGKLPVNIDIYLPSLPCSELVMEVTDESGSQELAVTDTLHKLRMDRHGAPLDLPERVEWGHVVAPAFQQRKIVRLMEETHEHLAETLGHLEHELEENPDLSAHEHEWHKGQLAQQAAALHGRLSMLADVAQEADADANGAHSHEAHLEMSSKELERMHEEVATTKVYSDAQREKVLANLHAMSRSVARLKNGTSDATASNLREALRIRLSILSDNVHGFVTAADIDRRDRYDSMRELLGDLANQTALLPATLAEHVNETLRDLESHLGELMRGQRGRSRVEEENQFMAKLRKLQRSLRGEEELPADYCGSCYGAATDSSRCCNTCADLKQVYAERRWGFPDASNFEQCKREARQRSLQQQEGEGCNIYGTMEVARVTGTFSIAPASRLPAARSRHAKLLPAVQLAAFNVTHQIKRLSFGTDFPGQHNPLDDAWTYSPAGAAVARYFLKVVPTTYEFVGGKSVHTNQFSVTQYFKALSSEGAAAMLPCITFAFELTPLRVKKTEQRAGTFVGFLTRAAALIGGLFTVAGILDSVLYQSTRHLEKLQLNKQG